VLEFLNPLNGMSRLPAMSDFAGVDQRSLETGRSSLSRDSFLSMLPDLAEENSR
jgi:hypothetical protein